MPFFNDGDTTIGPGNKQNPLTKNLFIRTWQGEAPLPPPGSELMITEVTEDFMVTEIGNDYMITE